MPSLDQQMTDRPTEQHTSHHIVSYHIVSHHITSHYITSYQITSHRSPALDETAVGEKVSVAEGTPEDTDTDISIDQDACTAVVSVDQACKVIRHNTS